MRPPVLFAKKFFAPRAPLRQGDCGTARAALREIKVSRRMKHAPRAGLQLASPAARPAASVSPVRACCTPPPCAFDCQCFRAQHHHHHHHIGATSGAELARCGVSGMRGRRDDRAATRRGCAVGARGAHHSMLTPRQAGDMGRAVRQQRRPAASFCFCAPYLFFIDVYE